MTSSLIHSLLGSVVLFCHNDEWWRDTEASSDAVLYLTDDSWFSPFGRWSKKNCNPRRRSLEDTVDCVAPEDLRKGFPKSPRAKQSSVDCASHSVSISSFDSSRETPSGLNKFSCLTHIARPLQAVIRISLQLCLLSLVWLIIFLSRSWCIHPIFPGPIKYQRHATSPPNSHLFSWFRGYYQPFN